MGRGNQGHPWHCGPSGFGVNPAVAATGLFRVWEGESVFG